MKTDIVFVLDRSGSMQSIAQDVEGGLRTFVAEQQQQDGEANFTLIHFDNQYENVINGQDVKLTDINGYNFQPRGSTALLDAIGRSIAETKERLKDKSVDKVLFVIFTDGMENASKEYTRDQIKELIKAQQNADWDFVFMGANQDSFAEAGAFGFNQGSVVNFTSTAVGTANALKNLSQNVSQYRCGTRTADNMFDGKDNIS